MKPKPFSALNHFTVPVAISPPWAQRVALLQNCKCENGTAAQLHMSENDESPRSHAPQALYCKETKLQLAVSVARGQPKAIEVKITSPGRLNDPGTLDSGGEGGAAQREG
ncbi:hypothetical protein SY2F82_21080 [Streptomyces sp. Y2F8-2]|nr:hypothetical protein SY2F82_21080 [Streptomyces sp. Y2F8-2]